MPPRPTNRRSTLRVEIPKQQPSVSSTLSRTLPLHNDLLNPRTNPLSRLVARDSIHQQLVVVGMLMANVSDDSQPHRFFIGFATSG